MQIIQASTAAELELARTLFREYADWLRVDLCFQRFAEELASLPGSYAPPGGRLLLAMENGRAAGCVALRPLDQSTCEMKRLYVRQAFQGHGLGKRLAETVISDAKSIGYTRMVLDTLPKMHRAIQLYQALGFVARPPYYDTPLAETIFMEFKL